MAGQKERIDILLAESFKELALRQPIEKITIKAITDRAGVIRPTFYNHFQDKYELLEWIIRVQILEPTRPLIHAGMIDEALMLVFTSVKLSYRCESNSPPQNTWTVHNTEKYALASARDAFVSPSGSFFESLP